MRASFRALLHLFYSLYQTRTCFASCRISLPFCIMGSPIWTALLVFALILVVLPSGAHAFGAGNIASISSIEGKNWRHGDIEDTLKLIAFLKGKKWTSMMIKRVYFGNWLRDYSQAVDVGTVKSIQPDTIRILLWVLSTLTFGYATAEFEVTSERLGVYRPEEHIDNPKDYADNQDARQYDPRLRGPVREIELQIDPETGMKNYIANEKGDWATSAAYVKYSFSRSIHYGRMYTSGSHGKGNEADLCEALRCLGQGLHTLEDFGAHSNYVELALREQGFHSVFPHVGEAAAINLRGKHVYPIVTGTFGMVDFFHSVLGEANDHFTQSDLNELDKTLGAAESQNQSTRGGDSGPASAGNVVSLLSKVPGMGNLCQEAEQLQRMSDEQAYVNSQSRGMEDFTSTRGMGDDFYSADRASGQTAFAGPPGSVGGPPGPGLPGTDIDPQKLARQIYPILEFRDKVVRAISKVIEKIPGLEALVEKITETVTLFIFSLLAPFIRPVIKAVTKQLESGSSTVVDASGKHQYEPWTDPHCTDPTRKLSTDLMLPELTKMLILSQTRSSQKTTSATS